MEGVDSDADRPGRPDGDAGADPRGGGGPLDRIRSSLPGGAERGIAVRFGIDARALAAFRIALGLLVVGDLLMRAREIRTFYTDVGVLPRSALAEMYPLLAGASAHTLSGSTRGQALLFLLGGGLALATTVGYRTRLATAGTLLLHASLYARNPYLLNGGDGLLVLALFLGVFLPLGERWSVDAVRAGRRGVSRRERAGSGPVGPAARRPWIADLATATVLLQLVVVYSANALFKLRSEAWMSGQAVRYALELEQFSVLLGPSLTSYPGLLVALNWLWIGLLWVAALLVLATGRLRTAVVGAFVAAHLGMLVTMRLGFFPLVVVAILLLYLPRPVWDRFERLVASGSLDAGLAGAVRESLDRAPAAPRGPDLPPSIRRRGRTLAAVVLVTVLLASVLWPAAALGAAEGTPAERVVDTDDYTWTLFAPSTPTHVVWYVAPATLESGQEVDALRGGPVDWSAPPDAADTYPSQLWHRYLNEIRWTGEDERRPLAEYLCREAGTPSGGQPTEVALYAMDRPIDAVGGGDVERHELFRHDCGTRG